MSQQQVCWDQSPNCNNSYVVPNPGYEVPIYPNPGYVNPGYPNPDYSDPSYSGSVGFPPVLFLALLIGLVISSLPPGKKKEEPKKTPEEKMFEAIGQYEGGRRNQEDGRRTQFIYTFKDPCIDECPPKKEDKKDDKKDDKKEEKKD